MIDFLLDYYKKNNPIHFRFLEKRVEEIEHFPLIKAHLNRYIDSLLSDNVTYEDIAESYNLIMDMQFREDIFFKKHKRYRYSTFAETNEFIYSDLAYMNKYMIGLGLTNMLWPVHWQLFEFFRTQLEQLPCGKDYLEVGMGHGLQFVEALRSKHYERYLGVDIAASSVELTRNLVQNSGINAEYQLLCRDVFELKKDLLFDFIVFGEVLEHMENPVLFLEHMKVHLNRDGYAYMSTCVNSPAIDHIYLFKSIAEINELLCSCGFEAVDEIVISEKEGSAASYAAVIRVKP